MSLVRTQIYLNSEQRQQLDELAATQQQTMAAIIREAIAEYVVQHAPDHDPLLDLIALGASGITDGSVEHDRELYEDD